jgi:hypothetical protein
MTGIFRKIAQASVLLLALSGLTGCFSPPPKQQELMARFRADRNSYETLRKMMQADQIDDILGYGREFRKGQDRAFESARSPGLSSARVEAYRSLMKQARIPRAFRSEHDTVALALDSWGMANRGWRVLIVNRRTPPRPLLTSLDDFQRSDKPNDWQEGYAHAEGDWYFKIIW